MPKPKLLTLGFLTASVMALTACGGNINSADPQEQTTPTENKAPTDFKPDITIDFQSIESKSSPPEQQALNVLKNNLNALVTHDATLYESGFADLKLAEAMSYYFDDHFLYRFTDLESIEKNNIVKNQFQITVLGQRFDSSLNAIEDLKMMYAIRKDEQGTWLIYSID